MGEKGSGCFGKTMACGCGGCVLVILAVVGFAVLGGGAAMFGISKSGPYAEALTRARSSPEVVAALGEPIEAGWMISGSINVTGTSGTADLGIPVSGPNGKARVYVVASKSAGLWTYDTVELELEATGERIDLSLPAEAMPEPEVEQSPENEPPAAPQQLEEGPIV